MSGTDGKLNIVVYQERKDNGIGVFIKQSPYLCIFKWLGCDSVYTYLNYTTDKEHLFAAVHGHTGTRRVVIRSAMVCVLFHNIASRSIKVEFFRISSQYNILNEGIRYVSFY